MHPIDSADHLIASATALRHEVVGVSSAGLLGFLSGSLLLPVISFE
jgi:hypothetical protein